MLIDKCYNIGERILIKYGINIKIVQNEECKITFAIGLVQYSRSLNPIFFLESMLRGV